MQASAVPFHCPQRIVLVNWNNDNRLCVIDVRPQSVFAELHLTASVPFALPPPIRTPSSSLSTTVQETEEEDEEETEEGTEQEEEEEQEQEGEEDDWDVQLWQAFVAKFGERSMDCVLLVSDFPPTSDLEKQSNENHTEKAGQEEGEETETAEAEGVMHRFVEVLKRHKHDHDLKTVYLMKEGLAAFAKRVPFLCTTSSSSQHGDADASSGDVSSSWPSMVYDDFLFLGDWDSAHNIHALAHWDIRCVVNCTGGSLFQQKEEGGEDDAADSVAAYRKKLRHLHVRVEDIPMVDIASHFDSSFQFIEDARKQSHRVLIHCHAGVSRSTTITLAYLMRAHRWTLKEAYQHVKTRRQVICPNHGFMQQLLAYEAKLFGSGKPLTNLDELDYEGFAYNYWA
ncbi:Dual specificity protein phosphatase 10 [Balamuthia mandrillaris]